MPQAHASIGVVGGSGLYTLLGDDAEQVIVDTPWGEPSEAVSVGELGGQTVAFLPRHGRDHRVPPHRINYRANLWALRSLGVERVLAPCAVGSLRAALAPGGVVVCDQLVNLTRGRADTFFDGPDVAHLSAPDPYCAELRPAAAAALRAAGMPTHDAGTVMVVDGPRFATRAESRLYAQWGGDVVNMTQYPEVMLARELGMCYVALAVVTDYDAGLASAPEVPAVTQEEVFTVFTRALDALRQALHRLVERIPRQRGCVCAQVPQAINH
ncbi:MAG TPA: S-methyl-5'-thioadenosine phosphorylase [Candidatus Dormibacteraeota bacterium]